MKDSLLKCAAVFSEDGRYRYSLSREWDVGAGQVCWIMLNPSKASADADDPTIRRCVGYTRAWGYAGLVVVNLFAQIATWPHQLLRAKAPIGSHNDAAILQAISNRRVVCAWGAGAAVPLFIDRASAVMAMLQASATPAFCLGVTAFGPPKHPVRLAKNLKLQPFALKGTCKLKGGPE